MASLNELLAQCESKNGYERQQAVEALPREAHRGILSALIRRANDWAEPVKDAAYTAIRQLLDDEHVYDLVWELHEFYALADKRRYDHHALIGEVERFLIQEKYHDILFRALNWWEYPVRVANLSLLTKYQLITDDVLVTDHISTDCSYIGKRVAESLSRVSDETFSQVSAALPLHPLASISRAGIERLLQGQPSTTDDDQIAQYLYSRHPGVRRTADAYLFGAPADSLRSSATALSHYRDFLSDADQQGQNAQQVKVALKLLIKFGEHDQALLDKALRHPNDGVRASTLALQLALYKQEAEGDGQNGGEGAAAYLEKTKALLVRMLEDDSDNVQGLVLDYGRRLKLFADLDDVLAILQSPEGEKVSSPVSLSFHLSRWDRLIFLAELASYPTLLEKASTGVVSGMLANWCYWLDRDYDNIEPTIQQVRRLHILAEQLLPYIEDRYRDRFIAELKRYDIYS